MEAKDKKKINILNTKEKVNAVPEPTEYIKTDWLNDSPPALNEAHLNKIETGIKTNNDSIIVAIAALNINETNIETNTTGIETNITDIETNKTNISTNTSNIATNTSEIATNTSNITTNKTNIATNTTDISTNKTNIATNTTDISTNKTNIETNKTNISTNTSGIATNKTNISTNTSKVTNLDNTGKVINEPKSNKDIATKEYVDNSSGGGGIPADLDKHINYSKDNLLEIYSKDKNSDVKQLIFKIDNDSIMMAAGTSKGYQWYQAFNPTGATFKSRFYMNENPIKRLGEPVEASDAATKKYVDDATRVITGIANNPLQTFISTDGTPTSSNVESTIKAWSETVDDLDKVNHFTVNTVSGRFSPTQELVDLVNASNNGLNYKFTMKSGGWLSRKAGQRFALKGTLAGNTINEVFANQTYTSGKDDYKAGNPQIPFSIIIKLEKGISTSDEIYFSRRSPATNETSYQQPFYLEIEGLWNEGVKGTKGDTGATGSTGPKGNPGNDGAKGDKGDKGDQGIQGIQGIQGVKGVKGDTGATGPKGDKGDKGDPGGTPTKVKDMFSVVREDNLLAPTAQTGFTKNGWTEIDTGISVADLTPYDRIKVTISNFRTLSNAYKNDGDIIVLNVDYHDIFDNSNSRTIMYDYQVPNKTSPANDYQLPVRFNIQESSGSIVLNILSAYQTSSPQGQLDGFTLKIDGIELRGIT